MPILAPYKAVTDLLHLNFNTTMNTKKQKITTRLNYKHQKKDKTFQLLFEIRNYTDKSFRIKVLNSKLELISIKKECLLKDSVKDPQLNSYLNKLKNKCKLTLDFLKFSAIPIDSTNLQEWLYYRYSDVQNYFEFVEDEETARMFYELLDKPIEQFQQEETDRKQWEYNHNISRPTGILEAINYYQFENVQQSQILPSLTSYINSIHHNDLSIEGFRQIDFDLFIRYSIRTPYTTDKNNIEQYYQVESINIFVKNIKILFKEFKRLGYKINQDVLDFTLVMGTRKNSHIKYKWDNKLNVFAITKHEFETIKNAKFKDKSLEQAKDLFILQSLLGGLRFSELQMITKDSFKKVNDKFLLILQTKKTAKTIDSPLHSDIIEILEKYDYKINSIIQPLSSYNRNLKKLAKELNLNRQILQYIPIAKADKPTVEVKELHELFSNKLARKFLVTALFYSNQGYTLEQISTITKHSISSIQYYVATLTDYKENMINTL